MRKFMLLLILAVPVPLFGMGPLPKDTALTGVDLSTFSPSISSEVSLQGGVRAGLGASPLCLSFERSFFGPKSERNHSQLDFGLGVAPLQARRKVLDLLPVVRLNLLGI